MGQSRGSSNVTATGNLRGSKKMRERWVSKLIAKKFSVSLEIVLKCCGEHFSLFM